MATAYTSLVDIAVMEDSDLRKQVAGACYAAAIAIMSEDPQTEHHENRFRWAQSVMRSNGAPMEWGGRMIWAVIADSETIRQDPMNATDSEVQTVVNGLVNTFANGG